MAVLQIEASCLTVTGKMLGLLLLATLVPVDAPVIAVLETEIHGTTFTPDVRASMSTLIADVIEEQGARPLPMDAAASRDARACTLVTCTADQTLAHPYSAALVTKVLAAAKSCVVTATWMNIDDDAIDGSAVRESACDDESLQVAFWAAVAEAAKEGVATFTRRARMDGEGVCGLDDDPPAPGYVTIDTNPPARVMIGGRLLGETPLVRAKFPPGCIEVEAISHDGAASARVRMQVEPNKVQRYRFSLSGGDLAEHAPPEPTPARRIRRDRLEAERRAKAPPPVSQRDVYRKIATVPDRQMRDILMMKMIESGGDERILRQVYDEATRMAEDPR